MVSMRCKLFSSFILAITVSCSSAFAQTTKVPVELLAYAPTPCAADGIESDFCVQQIVPLQLTIKLRNVKTGAPYRLKTDISGYFRVRVPRGNYIIATVSNGYHLIDSSILRFGRANNSAFLAVTR